MKSIACGCLGQQVRIWMILSVSLATFLLLFGSASAQLTSCSLEGLVVDSLGNPIVAANIVVTGGSLQGTRASTTDDHGQFTIVALPAGRSTVIVEHVGYQQVKVEDVSTYLGKTTSLGEIRLRQRTHELAEVIVSGAKPLIDPASTTLGANLSSGEIENLPVERNYRSVATLLPQANASYLNDEVNIGGATGRENKYFIDGVDVTDPVFSRVGTNLPYNFVKEVQVMSGGYEAEYKSVLGGLVNVITYSGSNEVHGSVFGFFTNNRLTASTRGEFLDPAQGRFSNYDMGFGIGGPIVRDELWYYVAYNPTFNRRTYDVPSFGNYIDKTIAHSFAGKISWKASSKLNLVFSSTGDPMVRTAVGDVPAMLTRPKRLENMDPYLSDQTSGGMNLSLQGSYILTDGILLDVLLSRTARNEITEPSTALGKTQSAFYDFTTGTLSGGGFGTATNFRSVTSGRIATTVQAHSHTLKGGLEYKGINQEMDMTWPVYLSQDGDSSYQINYNISKGDARNQVFSAYLQDNWQISGRLRVHAGVRWERQWILGDNGSMVHVVDGPLQPRAGFVYLLDAEGRQRLFGSYGRFVQEWCSGWMNVYGGFSAGGTAKLNQDPRNLDVQGIIADSARAGYMPPMTVLRGQHYDEFNLGYELLAARNLKLSIQGTHRTIREAINIGIVRGTRVPQMGNPGSGALSEFPEPHREYSALCLAAEMRGSDRLSLYASYVLSRNYGNYDGIFDSANDVPVPNGNYSVSVADGLRLATGLLPNDRTHVLKLSGSYRFDIGLTVGTYFTWQTGTPWSDFAQSGIFFTTNDWFLQQRGSAGRTPNIWDLSARLVYPVILGGEFQARLILDAFHIASERQPVAFMQTHYFQVDQNGNPDPATLNPSYGEPTAFQPAMSFRLGMEVSF